MQYRALRCKNCLSLLARATGGTVEIKCRKCKVMNRFSF